jgi:capsular polysaccharide biosynthesis protein
MELSLKDILKLIIQKWYIMFTLISVFVAIGTAISVSNYTKPKYTASTSFLFTSPNQSNVNLTVNNYSTYLATDYNKHRVSSYIEKNYKSTDYEVRLNVTSAILEVKVTSNNEELAKDVVRKYGELINEENNPIKKEGLVIDQLVPVFSNEDKPNISSLIIQIMLFAFIGIFIGGVIILTPLYDQKRKNLDDAN